MRTFLFILITFPLLLSARGWTELEGVVYEVEKYSDGDSFRAKRNRSDYVFRLYYVDAPESDERFPDRNQEQADYFGVTVEQALKGGGLAAEFLHDLLEKEKTFTVYTRYADARGGSDQKRYYAMVKIGDRWLSELLVENGFVRLHGVESELPDGTSSRIYWSRLRKLEREAREAHRGIWGLASGRGPQAAPQAVTLTAPTPVFQARPPHRLAGTLPAGWEVTVGAPTRPGFRAVSFTSPAGNEFTGEIQESQLP